MARSFEIIKRINKAILVIGILFFSSMAFAVFDVYLPGGAMYKADLSSNQLVLIGRDGKKVAAPDGMYMTVEGKKFRVSKGITTQIAAKARETASAE